MTRGLPFVVSCFALLVGCGGGHAAPKVEKTPETPGVVGLPGKLVDIGGGRSLFVNCVGKGTPTVVLESGFGTNAGVWQTVQPALGRTTRTCAYDRAGIGSSVAPPGVSDAQLENDDLRRLLEHLPAEPPYVLVGHSYGGLLVRLFAQAHPDETAGIVLVDAMGRDQTRRQMAIWPKSVAPGLRRELAAPVRENVNLAAGEAFAARIKSLGDVPLVVITANDDFADVPRRLARALKRQWFEMQDELAALSDDHLHVVAMRSDHFVMQAERQPDVIIRAIRTAVRAVRSHAHLPACRSVFRGAGVRCRAHASG